MRSSVAAPEVREWKAEPFRSILDSLSEVVFQTDSRGRWTFLNRAWEQITGFTVEESLGRPCVEFVHPEEREESTARFRTILERSKEFASGEVRFLTRGGGERWFLAQTRAELAADGTLISISGLMTDITERRGAEEELRAARRKLEFVSSSSPAVLYASTPGPPYASNFVTENVRTLLGYEPAQFIEQPGFWLTLMHPGDGPVVQRAIADLAARGEAGYCARMRHRDGSYRKVRANVRLVRDGAGAPVEVLGCAVDETVAREAEEALDRYGAIHEAISYAARRFLETGSWQSVIGAVLERLGQVTGASRIRVVKDPGQDGTPGDWTWAAPGIPIPQARQESDSSILPGLEWNSESGRALRARKTVCGQPRDFPESARVSLERDGVRSLAFVQIPVGRQVWGVLGLEDCLQEHPWTAAELGGLRSMAGLLGATIHREQNERALRYSEALLRTMTNAAPLALLAVDNRTDRVLYSNDRFCDVLGITHLRERLLRGELTNSEVMAGCRAMARDPSAFAADCFPFEDDEGYYVVQDQIPFRDGRTIRRFSTQIRDAEDQYFGRMYLFEDVSAQQRAEQALQRAHDELEVRVAERTAELQQVNSSLRVEIEERHRAEATLAQRESNFRALIDNTLDVIVVLDQRGLVRYISPSVRRVFQYEPEALAGWSGLELVHPHDRAEVLARKQELCEKPGTHPPLICRLRHKDETWHTVEIVGNNQVENPAVRGMILTVRDITERRRLEEQFRQAQKMEAVGRLAGGVAHDFNNLLTVIRGYSGLMAKRMAAEDPGLRNVRQVQRAAERAAALVQQLLAFSRKQIVEPKVLDIHAALADLERMLRRLIGEDIELTISPASEPLYVRIDPGQFEQIVMNLSVNARDAMPEGGSLAIFAGVHTPLSRLNCRHCRESSGQWAVLAMHDTGAGISQEVCPHIFEPFFTTKEVGKGTGLGLSMVYGAIEQAGGHICVESVPGRGSTFRICLPVADAPVPFLGDDGLTQPEGGTETVLVAEDEELVRIMIGDTLREVGYQVIEAVNGIQALEVLSDSDRPVHLLLTDVVMPRMSGPALVAQVSALRPEIKVLYISGHPRQELGTGSDFLRKPFTPEELLREVRCLLDTH